MSVPCLQKQRKGWGDNGETGETTRRSPMREKLPDGGSWASKREISQGFRLGKIPGTRCAGHAAGGAESLSRGVAAGEDTAEMFGANNVL